MLVAVALGLVLGVPLAVTVVGLVAEGDAWMVWRMLPYDAPLITGGRCPGDAVEIERAFYVCGIERNPASSAYGEVVKETGIAARRDYRGARRAEVVREYRHGERVGAVCYVNVEAGGDWYRLREGGWLRGIWLTPQRCSPENPEGVDRT